MIEELKKEELPKHEVVVQAPVKLQKKTGWQKFKEALIGDGDGKSIGDYIIYDILVPSLKKVIQQTITDSTDILLYGDSRNRNASSIPASRVSYRSYYDSNQRNIQPRYSNSRAMPNYTNIVLQTRGDAEIVLNQMDDVIDRYKVVRVADLYDFVGLTSNYTDNNYGWTDLRSAEIVRQADGYLLRLPNPRAID